MLDRVRSKKLDQHAMSREEQQKLELARALSAVVKAIYFQQDGVTLSDFALESTKFAKQEGEYWARAREMFSRSFEAYVAFNAERFGGTNEFLGLPDRLYSDVKDGFMERAYPNAADRMRLFAAVDGGKDQHRSVWWRCHVPRQAVCPAFRMALCAWR